MVSGLSTSLIYLYSTLRGIQNPQVLMNRFTFEQGEAAFCFYVPHLWNKLPEYLVSSFKSGLEKLLFTLLIFIFNVFLCPCKAP